jgi:muconate cycloisomerase
MVLALNRTGRITSEAALEQYSERMAELVIRDITSWIVDAPTTRKHRLSNTEITHQSYVIVRVTLKNGLSGYGEAATLGGPRWAEESVESIKSAVDKYLAPSLGDLCAFHFEEAALRRAKAATRNFAAKAAIESALYDAVGKSLGLPSSALLGGAVRSSMEVIWALASGDADQEIVEAQTKLAAREHRHFKIKIGFKRAPDDMVRLRRIIDAIGAESTIIVDVNQAWSEATAIKHIPELAEMGVALIEQPVAAGRLEAMARVAARSQIPIMIDEAAFTCEQVARAGIVAAGSVLSLKLVKSGGLMELKRAAGVAAAFGMELYGGCLIESGIGAAAHLAVFSTLPTLEWGTEHFGPRILVDDVTKGEIVYKDFQIECPTGPGLGISVNEDELRRMARGR